MPSNSSQQETEVTYANILDIRSKVPPPNVPNDEIADLIIKIENGEIDPVLIVSPRLWLDTKNKDNFKLWCALSFIRTSMLRVIKVPTKDEPPVSAEENMTAQARAQERRLRELMERMAAQEGPPRPTRRPPMEDEDEEEDVELPEPLDDEDEPF